MRSFSLFHLIFPPTRKAIVPSKTTSVSGPETLKLEEAGGPP